MKLDIRAAFFAGIFSLMLLAVASLVSLGSAGIGGAVVGGISIGLVLSLCAYLYRRWSDELEVELYTPREAPKIVSRIWPLDYLARTISKGMQADLQASGFTGSPTKLISEAILSGFFAFILLTPLSIVLALVVNPAFLTLMALPPAILMMPKVILTNKRLERKRISKAELLGFSVLASITQSAGTGIYSLLNTIIGHSSIFKSLEPEARRTKNLAALKTGNPVVSLGEVAKTHPDEAFSKFFRGYIGMVESGGDIVNYLVDKSEEFLNAFKFEWKSYVESVATIGEVAISIFFLLPMLLVASFLTPSDFTSLLQLMIAIGLPAITALLLGGVLMIQPPTYDRLDGNLVFGIAAGILVPVPFIVFSAPLWVWISAGVIAFSLFYGLSVLRQRNEIREIESALPEFINDYAEYKKMGYGVSEIFEKISGKSYNRTFDRVLTTIRSMMRMGRGMDDVALWMEERGRSWLARLTFFTLARIEESGGATARAFNVFTDMMRSIISSKKEIVSSLRLYQVLMYGTPIGLSVIFSLVTRFISGVESVPSVSGAPAILQAVPASVFSLVNVLIVVASACVAIIFSKASKFTVKNTSDVVISVSLAVLGITVIAPLISI